MGVCGYTVEMRARFITSCDAMGQGAREL